MTDIFQFQECLVEEYKRFSTSFTSICASDIRQVDGARGDVVLILTSGRRRLAAQRIQQVWQ